MRRGVLGVPFGELLSGLPIVAPDRAKQKALAKELRAIQRGFNALSWKMDAVATTVERLRVDEARRPPGLLMKMFPD